jgi:peptidyl-prolyl cis-trans isomerase C
MSTLRRLAREPFLHFLLLGAALFAGLGAVHRLRATERHRIDVGEAELRGLAARWAQQYGSPPSRQQLDALVQSHVREEILYREGLALGLDQDDEIVRRRLAQKMEFLLQDRAVLRLPDDAALCTFYQGHADRYRIPPRATFTHVFFSTDRDGEAAERRAERALAVLRAGEADRAPELGDRFPYLYDHAGVSPAEVTRLFGETPFAAAVLTAPVGAWVGPLRSGYGWHLLHVSERAAPRLPPLEELTEQVRGDLAAEERARANAAAFERLRAGYSVSAAPAEVRDALAAR